MRLARFAIVLSALALGAGACGDDDGDASTAPNRPPAIGVDEAAAHDGEAVVLEGFLLAAPEAVHRLCSALAESYPPQCAGARVEIVGLDVFNISGTTTNAELPEGERTLWTDRPIRLTGTLEGDRLVLVSTAEPLGDDFVVVSALAGERPLIGAVVELWGADDSVGSTSTDQLGVAVFAAAPGDHAVVALPAEGLAPPAPLTVSPGDAVVLEYDAG